MGKQMRQVLGRPTQVNKQLLHLATAYNLTKYFCFVIQIVDEEWFYRYIHATGFTTHLQVFIKCGCNVKIQLAGGSVTPCLCSLDNRDGNIEVNKKHSESANMRRA